MKYVITSKEMFLHPTLLFPYTSSRHTAYTIQTLLDVQSTSSSMVYTNNIIHFLFDQKAEQ